MSLGGISIGEFLDGVGRAEAGQASCNNCSIVDNSSLGVIANVGLDEMLCGADTDAQTAASVQQAELNALRDLVV